ncbi:MAG: CDP-diacylglycerol--glycerol-3-phosphate 3-phosphatidyltransferase [Phycisphaerae bacterium]
MTINIPNQVTLGRLVLALIFFVLLSLFSAADDPRWLLVAGFWVFLVAAVGDAVDGLLARWLKQVTSFGRIVDPVVDKIMVCGAFVLFAGPNFMHEGQNITGVQPWMVLVILIREFLVSAIRAHAESGGKDFGANWVGKLKMFVQSATVCIILGQLGWRLDSMAPLRTTCVWLTVLVTALSIIVYVRRARSFLLSSAALGSTRPKSANEPSPSGEEDGA